MNPAQSEARTGFAALGARSIRERRGAHWSGRHREIGQRPTGLEVVPHRFLDAGLVTERIVPLEGAY